MIKSLLQGALLNFLSDFSFHSFRYVKHCLLKLPCCFSRISENLHNTPKIYLKWKKLPLFSQLQFSNAFIFDSRRTFSKVVRKFLQNKKLNLYLMVSVLSNEYVDWGDLSFDIAIFTHLHTSSYEERSL